MWIVIMNNSRLVTRLVLLGIAGTLTALSLFSQWGSITMPPNMKSSDESSARGEETPSPEAAAAQKMLEAMFSNLSLPVTGLNGWLRFGFLNVPNWAIVALVALGLAGTAWNTMSVHRISQTLVWMLLLLGAAMCGRALIFFLGAGPLAIGTPLLLAAAIIGLCQQRPLSMRERAVGDPAS